MFVFEKKWMCRGSENYIKVRVRDIHMDLQEVEMTICVPHRRTKGKLKGQPQIRWFECVSVVECNKNGPSRLAANQLAYGTPFGKKVLLP